MDARAAGPSSNSYMTPAHHAGYDDDEAAPTKRAKRSYVRQAPLKRARAAARPDPEENESAHTDSSKEDSTSGSASFDGEEAGEPDDDDDENTGGKSLEDEVIASLAKKLARRSKSLAMKRARQRASNHDTNFAQYAVDTLTSRLIPSSISALVMEKCFRKRTLCPDNVGKEVKLIKRRDVKVLQYISLWVLLQLDADARREVYKESTTLYDDLSGTIPRRIPPDHEAQIAQQVEDIRKLCDIVGSV
jgi:hypothetical protein